MKTFLKILFSVLFLAITVIWVVFALQLFQVININLAFLDDIYNKYIEPTADVSKYNAIGIYMIVGFGALLLAYLVILFPVKKIPLIGTIISWLTGFISLISVLGVVAGVCLVLLM